MGDTAKQCQTARAECTTAATWQTTLGCCGERRILCDAHAAEGMAEWAHEMKTKGGVRFVCWLCWQEDIPWPEWRTL